VFAVFEAQLKEFAAALLLLGSKDYCPACKLRRNGPRGDLISP
jgi:hypothetical protein